METKSNGDHIITIMTDEQEFYKLKEKVNSIEKDTSRIWAVVAGNGREGIIERTVRIEENIKDNSENIKGLKESLDVLVKGVNETNRAIGELNRSVCDHIDDKLIHSIPGLIRGASGKIIIGLLIAGLIFNLLVQAIVPHNISVWDVLSKWLGL